ncbi:MAG TPA: NADH-ubiquinone oxidoreductase-F iron-sulfur binding region domain-containing protein [Rectinemataceae bacterium]|nr:NADH-ubiquinone oxidoreductase-F iron-sulfur binding region domain-containing protein [Rectinemataceae bacterium]
MAEERRIALSFLGRVDPGSIDDYIAAGGYAGLKAALAMDPGSVVAELSRAGLRGRGGAGFPTGRKELSTAEACGECDCFVVCNADEGEPGTFKDRIIMEGEPQLLIEGMIISAYAIGAGYGYVYIRGEYARSIELVGKAIEEAKARGFLGRGILGSAFSFDIELRRGAGSYLCGEELTLIESLEGKRGYPRIKPPFPAEVGYRGTPTLVNNVETFANLPFIVEQGADAYLALGTPSSPGTKIFCISGDVVRPGFAELEFGVSLRSIIDDLAGGVSEGGPALAVLLGGAAGTFVAGEDLDIPMDFDSLRKQGLSLGSGAVIVLGAHRSLAATISSIMDFFAHESCGKCIPCRVGTTRLAASAARLGSIPKGERKALLLSMVDEARLMASTSLCPLGQSPILPLESVARRLADSL